MNELKEMKDENIQNKFIKLRKISVVNNYITFWNLVLLSDDSSRIEFEKTKKDVILFYKNGVYDDNLFFNNIKEVSNEAGTPDKDFIIIMYGYEKESTARAFQMMRGGVNKWLSYLDAKWKGRREFHAVNIGFIPTIKTVRKNENEATK